MHVPTISAISGMISALARAPKAVQDDIEGLVGIEVRKNLSDADPATDRVLDQWNRDDEGRATPGIDVGPQERASGTGAAKMTREYSDPSPQNALVDSYSALNERLSHLEKAMSSVVGFLSAAAKASGGSFPADADGENGDAEEGETRDDREDDNQASSAAAKAARGQLPVMNVPMLMETLARGSRHPITPPPSFTMSKAHVASVEERISDADLPLADALRVQSTLSMLRSGSTDPLVAQRARDRLAALPPHLHDLIVA